jgi:hypothetical protein
VKRTTVRLGALASAAALTLLSAAPAHAATVAESSANALSLNVAGSGTDSGTVTATHDGTDEERTGNNTPAVDVLDNQGLVNLGAAAQNATALVNEDGAGVSAACAGVVGDGGSVAQVGDSDCIEPGQPIGLSVANLDLTGLDPVNPESALGPLNEALGPLSDQVLEPLTAEISSAITENIAPLADLGIAGTLGGVQARCLATPGRAEGYANIIDSRLTATVAGEEVVLADLPAEPAPNTDLLVNLDEVAGTVLAALRTDLENSLDEQLSDLTVVTDQVQEQVVENVLGQIAPQLQPLSDNVLRITLNEQSADEDSIEVTALHAEVLPAAEQLGSPVLLDARIGNVTCGPNGTMTVGTDNTATPEAGQEDLPEVPTVVASGVEGSGDGLGYGSVALASLVALAGAAGVIGLRRSITQ